MSDPIARAPAAAPRIEHARQEQSRARSDRQQAMVEARVTMSPAPEGAALGNSRPPH